MDSTFAVHADIKWTLCINSKVIRVLNASLKVQKRCLSFLPKKFPSVSVVLPSSAFELTTAPFKSKWTFAINCLNLSVAWGWVLWIPDLPCGRPWAFKSLFLKWMNNQKCLSSFTFWKFRNSKIFWFAGPGTQKLWLREPASSNFSRQIRRTRWRKPPAGVKVALNFGKFGILYSIYFPWSPGKGVYWTLRQKADKLWNPENNIIVPRVPRQAQSLKTDSSDKGQENSLLQSLRSRELFIFGWGVQWTPW